MGEPKTEWGQDLIKEVKAMAEEIKTHREEVQARHTEFLVFRTRIDTALSHLDPREIASQFKNLSTFESRLNTLISVGKSIGGILIVFALGLIVTLVGAANQLTSALATHAAEIGHQGKQLDRAIDKIDRMETALPRSVITAKTVEDGLAAIDRNLEILAIRDPRARNFEFILTAENLLDKTAKSFRLRGPLDEDAARRYEKIAQAFPDHATKVSLVRLSSGLRGQSVADENFLSRFAESVSIGAQVAGREAVFTFEPRNDQGAEILKTLSQGLASKKDEFLKVVLRVYF